MSKHVLIIDDSLSIRQMVRFTLESHGYTVTEAEDGQIAVDEKLQGQVDIVITDLYMPHLDGVGVIKAIREHNDYRFIPIIVLTTESEQQKKLEARKAGATGWIIKPFDPDKLIAVVRKVLG